MIDTNSLEWKLRKLGENIDMLKRACEDNRHVWDTARRRA
jgi:hypothetical protein